MSDYVKDYPNVRDCEHGCLRGKCVECELAETRAERDALAERLREAMDEIQHLVDDYKLPAGVEQDLREVLAAESAMTAAHRLAIRLNAYLGHEPRDCAMVDRLAGELLDALSRRIEP